jgi:hypothetical protein
MAADLTQSTSAGIWSAVAIEPVERPMMRKRLSFTKAPEQKCLSAGILPEMAHQIIYDCFGGSQTGTLPRPSFSRHSRTKEVRGLVNLRGGDGFHAEEKPGRSGVSPALALTRCTCEA